MSETFFQPSNVTRDDVFRVVATHFEPFNPRSHPIGGDTQIQRDLTIDSSALLDSVMEFEDRFDVSIPISTLADIHSVDELVDAIYTLAKQNQ